MKRFERDVLEAMVSLDRWAPLWELEEVSGWTLQGRMTDLSRLGAVARSGIKGAGVRWFITERGRIALAIQRGIEARNRS